MDFFKVKEKSAKEGVVEVYPDFVVGRITQLMVRSRSFYAVLDVETNMWLTDEIDIQRIVDDALWARRNELAQRNNHGSYRVVLLGEFGSGAWRNWRNYLLQTPDNETQLDQNLTFANTVVKPTDYVSRRLPYSLEAGDYHAWDELLATLYEPEEREKIEWSIGSIVAGDSKHIQKMFVYYGAPGTGKSTILNIIGEKLFPGYSATYEAKALTSGNNAFATEVFRNNPLVAIEQDGDLSQIKDYTKLNSIVSHEMMTFNEKFKPSYDARVNALLMMGTNSPVKISDAKAGIIRRLIDIHPSGRKIPARRYHALMSQVDFELGAIAQHCLDVYRAKGKDYYENYTPVEMMLQTDVFYNYIEQYYDIFREQDGVTLTQAYELYKLYCEESDITFKTPKYKFREELRNYFSSFDERAMIDGERVRSWYSGFRHDKFKVQIREEDALPLVMDETDSIFDSEFATAPAQYANANETPIKKWDDVTTELSEIDTSKIHYVKVPENHIVIDFDLKDADGNKSAELNLEAASKWPPTYSEFSKGGGGIHLHYNYVGDPTQLSRVHSDGIEVKVFTGNSSLRRRLSKCNNVPIASINTGLKLKEKKMISNEKLTSERGLRNLLERCLAKEIEPGHTAPLVDFMKKILDDAYSEGLQYDVTDMRHRMIMFANNSSNQSLKCLATVQKFQLKGKDVDAEEPDLSSRPDVLAEVNNPDQIVFFDVEVYPNLFLISWKYRGSDQFVHMINPKPHEVENLLRMKLVGYNCRRYDNHIVYAASMGYSNEALYALSQRLINNDRDAYFQAAWSASYTDIYDYASKKQSLKKWEVELEIKHKEMGLPWDQPVPEELWEEVVAYCDNDVAATEATFNATAADFTARQIIADLAGMSVNQTTQNLAAKIIFEGDREPWKEFVYDFLGEDKLGPDGDILEKALFPGYTFKLGRSKYRDEDPGEGGYVYAEPGLYTDVALLDVTSMHPNSIIALNHFGKYTKNFKELIDARVAIKNKDFATARKMFGGRLVPYLKDESQADKLAYALKIVINIVYGLTSAKFQNPFRDPRNKDNIVAKRGALFMIDLKNAVQEQGFTVAHIKTDSIKIPNATPEIIQFVSDFGAKYGYNFEHEATYDRIALVNDAVYVAKDGDKWSATGAQFQHPYVFKTLFSHEPITFNDMRETKQVQKGTMYLDFTDVTADPPVDKEELTFVGRIGVFTPIKEGEGGGLLVKAMTKTVKVEDEAGEIEEEVESFMAVTGTKGYRWMESEMVQELGKEDDIEEAYFRELCDEAYNNIAKFGDPEWFLAA